ncbi:Os06g0191900 [Oryza sativa Japonica Group]|uniref:Os06g0191900 protein n=1 Tax=Oryza sativa subsp. japonica TaxID=39947 RepID=Q0DDX7_ORYSJ|nr:Os06g0191900 [Oryza sativa Japonica Group]|eukprot:NP_001057032.2 Os06g0191900 [Oryza sativa Japonica Group]
MERYHDGKDLDTSSYPLVAVCIDKDKNSQNALKWAIDTLVQKGQIIVLVHVNTKGTSGKSLRYIYSLHIYL